MARCESWPGRLGKLPFQGKGLAISPLNISIITFLVVVAGGFAGRLIRNVAGQIPQLDGNLRRLGPPAEPIRNQVFEEEICVKPALYC